MIKKALVVLVMICFTGTSHAAMIATSTDRSELFSIVDRADVQRQLQSYGITAEQAKARIAALSNEEAAQLAAQIENLPAGGDALGAIVGALVLIFIVLLITDILGLTKVFPFTKPIK